jgi:RNA polymerase sigma factor (sigma-70 family)
MHDDSAIMLACVPRLRRYARALVGHRGGADDLVQDTMERGWSKLSSWRRDSDMRAWLFAIMHNVYVDQLRKSSVVTEPLDDDTPVMAQRATQADGLVIRDLEAALRRLAPEQREILLLVGLEEMTYDEVASTLGIPLGTVMSRLSRAREKLRASMEGQPLATPLKVVK